MQGVLRDSLRNETDALKEGFATAKPFRHVCITDFLDTDFYPRIQAEFPVPQPEQMRSEFGDKSLKHTVQKIARLGDAFKAWDATLRSPAFIAWLETITGIEGLLFDPDYEGAGTHNNLHGQSLDLHIDFNHHYATRYHRRLNLIVYLNDEWEPGWGGAIELHENAWDRSGTGHRVSYLPSSNVAVLFETNEHSWHGFKQINLPEDKRHLSRKSLTVYYYSKTRPADESAPDHSTIYVPDWIPESIKPGHVLTHEAFAELEQLMTRRDHYLQRLYDRETDLQNRYSQTISVLQPIKRVLHRVGLLTPLRRLLGRQ